MTFPEPTELSERELEILRLVATGAGNKEIAQKLFISTNTVKVHIRNIFTKIGASSRTEAAMYAVRTGLVTNPASQVTDEDNDENTSHDTTLPVDTMTTLTGEEVALPSNRKFPFWISLFFIGIFILLLLLGWRLSPGINISTKPTTTPVTTSKYTYFYPALE